MHLCNFLTFKGSEAFSKIIKQIHQKKIGADRFVYALFDEGKMAELMEMLGPDIQSIVVMKVCKMIQQEHANMEGMESMVNVSSQDDVDRDGTMNSEDVTTMTEQRI